ncbi:hypothetical protein CLOSTMETH_00069 [[Clostridium] methylpentosum DSM 5476]|uniref:Uncharacterized protein n=1 Tax=[Clostridium] methylpentosum DSM 5476 TaxID=537013 RepID=C0E897_9FIRM|nr:hypothetical protein CLOSTMETH_00069 [[Clostridium] methylpentosum DSM 5476]
MNFAVGDDPAAKQFGKARFGGRLGRFSVGICVQKQMLGIGKI